MFENETPEPPGRPAQPDLAVAAVRTTLGLIGGPVGVIVGEFITLMAPRQRLDRLCDLVRRLEGKLEGAEAFRRRLETSAEYQALFEDASLVAVRSPSAEQRERIAELLKTGLTKDAAELLEHQALLRLLAELNDAQLVILVYYGCVPDHLRSQEAAAYLETHGDVFARSPSMHAPPDVFRRWAMFKHYRDRLLSLGLLDNRDGLGGMKDDPRIELSLLGRYLLEATGMEVVK